MNSDDVKDLRKYLDTLNINGDNIGGIRASLMMPWDSPWNALVRDETAAREKPVLDISTAHIHEIARSVDSWFQGQPAWGDELRALAKRRDDLEQQHGCALRNDNSGPCVYRGHSD